MWSDEAFNFLSNRYDGSTKDWSDKEEAEKHMLGWWELDKDDTNQQRLEEAIKFFKCKGYIGWYAGGLSIPNTVELFDKLIEMTKHLNNDYIVELSSTHILLRAGGKAYDNSPLF